LQCARRQRIAAIRQHIAGLRQRQVQRMAEFLARGGLVALGHPRAWFRLRRRRRRRLVAKPPYRADGGSEQVGVVVFV
jgi:hypothetical protein